MNNEKITRNNLLIYDYLQGVGINLRKKSPYKSKYNVNFFDVYSKESAYWAGFIAADGCIRSDRDALEIGLIKTDELHLNKLSEVIDFTGKLIYYKNSVKITICGKWFPEALLYNYNITPVKSLTYNICEKIPIEYIHHFIRGMFDGDGCITFTTAFTINFTGTYNVCNYIRKYLYKSIAIRIKSRNDYPPIQKTGHYQISYSGKNAIKILKCLYSESTQQTRLDRKYNLYLKEINSKN